MTKEEKKNEGNGNVRSLVKKTLGTSGGFAIGVYLAKQAVKGVSADGLYGAAPYLDALAKFGGGSAGRGTLAVVAVIATASVAGYVIADHADKKCIAAGKEG